MVIAPECKTALGRLILAGDRFVDDILTSHEDKELLLEALDDIVEILARYGFMVKSIISNNLWYHRSKGLLKDDNTSIDGLFTEEETSETTFHHKYSWKNNSLKLNFTLSGHPGVALCLHGRAICRLQIGPQLT